MLFVFRCPPSAGSGNCGLGPSLRATDQFPNRVELVVARENHRLSRSPAMFAASIVHLLILLFDEHEVPEDVEEAVALEHLLPEVAGAIAGRMLRIASAAVICPGGCHG